jgi:hypothetical protein
MSHQPLSRYIQSTLKVRYFLHTATNLFLNDDCCDAAAGPQSPLLACVYSRSYWDFPVLNSSRIDSIT